MSRGAGALFLCALVAALWPAAASAGLTLSPAGADLEILRKDGSADTRAGSHPDRFMQKFGIEDTGGEPEYARELTFELPAGMNGDPRATPLCPQEVLAYSIPPLDCPPESQVGVLRSGSGSEKPIYNIEPGPNQVIALGVTGFQYAGYFAGSLRQDDLGVSLSLGQILPQEEVIGSGTVELWGIPADHQTGTSIPRRALLTTSTSCGSAPSSVVGLRTWQRPAVWHRQRSDFGQSLGDCPSLPFAPSVGFGFESPRADVRSGAQIDIAVPQSPDPDGRATSLVKVVAVQLPEGMTLSPGGADGLVACRDAELGKGTVADAACPAGSRVGSVALRSSALGDDPVVGTLYVGEGRPGDRLRLFVVASARGTQVKLTGSLRSDPRTGRLTAELSDLPQLPFDAMTLHFDGGPNALLATPLSCGPAKAQATFTPYSGTAPVQSTATVSIAGPGGGACSGQPAFNPTFTGGATSAAAGKSTAFRSLLTRRDGEQIPAKMEIDFPKGMSANVGSVTKCAESQAASGSCPQASRIGSALAELGPGPDPAQVKGQIFLTGPYRAQPYGLALAFAGKVGPLDLGTLVVRGSMQVDSKTGQLSAVIDSLPRVFEGIAVRFQAISLQIDRPGFLANPTSCTQTSIVSSAGSVANQLSRTEVPFKVSGCVDLPFKPSFALALKGRSLKKGAKPGLSVQVKPGTKGANMRSADIAMPSQPAPGLLRPPGNLRPAQGDRGALLRALPGGNRHRHHAAAERPAQRRRLRRPAQGRRSTRHLDPPAGRRPDPRHAIKRRRQGRIAAHSLHRPPRPPGREPDARFRRWRARALHPEELPLPQGQAPKARGRGQERRAEWGAGGGAGGGGGTSGLLREMPMEPRAGGAVGRACVRMAAAAALLLAVSCSPAPALAAPQPGTPIAVAPGVPSHGRSWELTTMPEPAQSLAFGFSAAPDGDSFAFTTWGVLPGYPSGAWLTPHTISVRGPGGWSVAQPPGPHPELINGHVWSPLVEALGPGGESGIWGAEFPGAKWALYLRDRAGAYTTLVEDARFAGASTDLQRIVFSSGGHRLPADATRTEGESLYERSGANVRLLDVAPGGQLISDCGSSAVDVSADARRVYFTVRPSCTGITRLYLAESGTVTREASGSHCTADCGAPDNITFVGATPDGTSVLFSTQEKLTDNDTNSHADLYRYDAADDTLTLVTNGAGGPDLVPAGNPVFGMPTAWLSGDGSVYFFAAEQATPGDVGIYRGDGSGVSLISSTATTELAGVSASGRYALLNTTLPLEAGDDDGSKDVYRYDAANGTAVRVSDGPAGGNGPFAAAAVGDEREMVITILPGSELFRPMSEDGSRIFFVTDEPLVAADTNGASDVYEWANGDVGLISSGAGKTGSALVTSTPDGQTVFFKTSETLLAGDRDADDFDFYAARIGGGFAEAFSSVDPCPCDRSLPGRAALDRSGADWQRGVGWSHRPAGPRPRGAAAHSSQRLDRAAGGISAGRAPLRRGPGAPWWPPPHRCFDHHPGFRARSGQLANAPQQGGTGASCGGCRSAHPPRAECCRPPRCRSNRELPVGGKAMKARRGLGRFLAIAAIAFFAVPAAADAELTIVPSGTVMETLDGAGQPDNRAGAHPYKLRQSFKFENVGAGPDEDAMEIFIELPAGISGNANAVPFCSKSAAHRPLGGSSCPPESQVGVIVGGGESSPIYNVSPGPNQVAEFAPTSYFPAGVVGQLRTTDQGLTLRIGEIPSTIENDESGTIELWAFRLTIRKASRARGDPC